MEQQDTTNQQQTPTTQRIWIGGLNPPSLTVEMVQERIKRSLGDKLEILKFDGNLNKEDAKSKTLWGEDSRTFFFVTAKSKITDEEMVSTPLDLIAKQYNRVKWKGCILQVEQAKLHFLQRLELERQEEKEREAKEKSEKVISHNVNNTKDTQQQLSGGVKSSSKRHLRIRKQHGVEAYIVDTKPIETKDWKESMFTIKKQRSKYKKQEEKLVEFRRRKNNTRQRNNNNHQRENDESIEKNENYSLQSKTFLNRAVHLIIPCNVDYEVNHVKDQILAQSGSDTGTGNNCNVEINSKKQKDTNGSSSDNEINKDSSSEDSASVTEDSEPESINQKNGIGEYKWSDSDDDTDDSDFEQKAFTRQNHNAFDEFESALIDQPVNFDDDDEMNKYEEVIDSLEDDVISNLKLLTHLYPDLKVRLRREDTTLAKDSSIDNKLKPGWNSNCLIQRYDPSAQSDNSTSKGEHNTESAQHVVESDDDICSKDDSRSPDKDIISENGLSKSNEDDGISSEDDDSSSDKDIIAEDYDSNSIEDSVKAKEIDDAQSPKVINGDQDATQSSEKKGSDQKTSEHKPPDNLQENNNYIYEEKKLENIFQGNRNFQLSSLFTIGKDDENNPERSTKTPEDTTNESTFMFSFGTGASSKSDEDEDEKDKRSLPVNKESSTATEINKSHADSESNISSRPAKLTEINSFFYSSKDLDLIQGKFFKLNEGLDFLLNIHQHGDMREKDKAQWQDERKTLTLDWKRKQKYAQSKKKRMKFR